MFTIQGKYSTAKIFTDNIEEEAVKQIQNLVNQPFTKNASPAFMPDVHAGKGCTIGTTMKITDSICPNLVGVDIGCGMRVCELNFTIKDFTILDEIVHQVPSGQEIHEYQQAKFDLDELICKDDIGDHEYLLRSIGTLGGGNHFIELDEDECGKQYLVIHSGSRYLGKKVCEHYMKLAEEQMQFGKANMDKEIARVIEELKSQNRVKEIQQTIKSVKEEYAKQFQKMDKDLATLTGSQAKDYLHDMKICQQYAILNRMTMAKHILNGLIIACICTKQQADEVLANSWESVHNYISFEDNILRKGAISAHLNEKVLIPLNMKDGSIIGFGKGNEEANCSANHGSGRKMSRSKAKSELSMSQFEKEMNGIYSTCISTNTLDESPMAYKDSQTVLVDMEPLVTVDRIIKPVYNFKAN